MSDIKLGDKVTDPITGFSGTATARVEYLCGCIQWQIEESDMNGVPTELWADEGRIKVDERERVNEGPRLGPMGSGGPTSAPPPHHSTPSG